ncbi:MAG: Gfo/Idh/MocA family oxidoreductase [Holophagales bacterium]|jgi:predicted dehydrogenase|nr:Gfo/Idh/MocA family oxidoreductase [Holophagales bacterium]
MAKLKVAVVGVGSLGQHHARIAAASERTELVAVVDASPERGREIAAKFNTSFVTDLGSAIESADAVQVAAPTGVHLEIGKQALERGKHLLIEKPLAGSLEQGRALLELFNKVKAEKPSLIGAVGHLERYNPAVIALRTSGLRPRFAEAIRVSPFPMRSLEVDVVMDVMIHDLDLLLSLFNRKVQSVEALGVPVLTPFPDIVNARIKFEGGSFATVTASRVARKKERVLRIFGEGEYAALDFAEQKLERLKLVKTPEGDPQVVPDATEIARDEPLRLELEAFYQACLGQKPDIVTFQEAFEAMEVADQVQRAIKTSLAEAGFKL